MYTGSSRRDKGRRGWISVRVCPNSEKQKLADYLVGNKEALLQYAASVEGINKNRLESAMVSEHEQTTRDTQP